MKLCLTLICAVLLSTEAKTVHKHIAVDLCSDTDQQSLYGLDGEELWYADFEQGIGVLTIPQFADPSSFEEGAYENSVINVEICKQNLAKTIAANNNPAELTDAPQSSLYSKDDVELGSNNTLVCFITGFYPPRIGVWWTKNSINVTGGVSFSRFYPLSDGTFNLISRLSFIPEKGDVYTCTVEHASLDRHLTKTWDVQEALPNVGPIAFCGVGLGVGLIGVIVGIVFLVKGKKCN
ncbi:H-2 class II histocompatibility antigen, A-U alpha chain-like [Colossoma macropomum]|uniref:H-2 class II histocompatibility antigen, A-U alpha chain-like n=1 Tax=Colossoma macropomum TaxID=42526 RepID=UPI0018649870|nr:H-2 class II histocompatibility antigen, A-U alpha chain-like [Colossoma macropomum]